MANTRTRLRHQLRYATRVRPGQRVLQTSSPSVRAKSKWYASLRLSLGVSATAVPFVGVFARIVLQKSLQGLDDHDYTATHS